MALIVALTTVWPCNTANTKFILYTNTKHN